MDSTPTTPTSSTPTLPPATKEALAQQQSSQPQSQQQQQASTASASAGGAAAQGQQQQQTAGNEVVAVKSRFANPNARPIRHVTSASTTDRAVRTVAAPAANPLSHEALFGGEGGKIDMPTLQKHLLQEGKLSTPDLLSLIKQVTDILRAEPTLLTIDSPITICGDVHGQYFDLVKLFEIGGPVSKTTYLFLGDYVDRGSFSMEVLIHLYSLKILYRNSFYLIRGNHECRHLTEYFTFKEECCHKYSNTVYEAALESFNALPLGAIVNGQFLCIHGGISPEIKTLDDIRKIDRFREPPSFGPMCDLLWADPAEDFSPASGEHFGFNEVRGCSYVYTYNAACAFLERNRLLSLVRAHEAQDEGYRMYKTRDVTGFPTVITIFSAPNYLDAYNNKGAVLRYDKSVLNIRQFNQSPHPYWLPNFIDVFTWSLPFVAEKIAEMLLVFFKMCDDTAEEAAEAQEENLTDRERLKRREIIKEKIKSVSRFMRMYSTLREEQETVKQLKFMGNNSVIPRGLLLGGRIALQQAR